MTDLTIVTGARSNDAVCLGNLLRSIVLSRVRARTVVYDFGLDGADAQAIGEHCDELRRFEFEHYPPWIDLRVNAGPYAWKPILVADLVAETGGRSSGSTPTPSSWRTSRR